MFQKLKATAPGIFQLGLLPMSLNMLIISQKNKTGGSMGESISEEMFEELNVYGLGKRCQKWNINKICKLEI